MKKTSESLSERIIEEAFIRSWWVILFTLGCYLCYEQGLQKKEFDFIKLQMQYAELQKKKKTLQMQQENFQRQLNSQDDPAWIELVLMNVLGLVPEGQTKVLFIKDRG